MTDDADRELARLRRENAALNEQVKLLVQTEQRAYRMQNAREHELRRIRALGEYGIELVSLATPTVFARTVDLLRECFAIDQIELFDMVDAGWPADAVAFVRSLTNAIIIPARSDAPEHVRLLAVANMRGDNVHAVLPLVDHTVVIAGSSLRRRPVYREDPINDAHLPLFQMIVAHVRRVVEHRQLTEDLQARSAMLIEVNRKLADSLRTVEQAQTQLLQAGKMDAIGRLAGGVAHDFNNLLTVILNHAALAAAGLPPQSAEAEDLDAVIRAGTRAAEITSQLLALGRKSVQRRERVDVGLIARDIGRVLQDLIGRAFTLIIDTEPGCTVFADRSQLEQVILNLVVNARDAKPRDGAITLTVRRTGQPDGRDAITIEVVDRGIGMDDETRARIFEPFFTTKGDSHGTGLGLAVVYGVVTQSGGTITVDSEPGVGSRFIVELPRCCEPIAQASVERAPAIALGANVLLVEDSSQIRRVAHRILTRAGYRVHEARDGVEACELIAQRASDFDLVLTDLNMPRMGGFELARQVAIAMPRARVLFMTGFSDELAAASLEAPAIECMTKPFTPEQLLTRVGEQLARP